MKRRTLSTAPDRYRQTPPFRRHPLAAAISMALAAGPAGAATIIADGKNCILIDAITAANTDTATGGCHAGRRADIIKLKYDVTLTTVDNDTDGPNGLPSVTSVITINGHGHTIARSSAEGTPEFRLLHVTESGNLTLKQVTLQNGRAGQYSSGGALFNLGTVALVDSTVSGNSTSSEGGGLFNFFGTVTLINSTVSGNYARGGGGGLANRGSLTLTNSTISSNKASAFGDGGGLLSDFGTVTLINSTVSGNSALSDGDDGGFGGGLRNSDFSTITLTNSTISGNYATFNGGGLYNRGTVTLTNTLIANSTGGGDCTGGGAVTPTGINLIVDGGCNASAFPAGTDPKLGPLANNSGPTRTHALLKGSPAIDTIALGVGGCGTTIRTDQRGVSRPQPAGGKCDIGSFELIKAPALSIKSIIDFFDQAVKDGDLRGTGPGKSAKHRLRARAPYAARRRGLPRPPQDQEGLRAA